MHYLKKKIIIIIIIVFITIIIIIIIIIIKLSILKIMGSLGLVFSIVLLREGVNMM